MGRSLLTLPPTRTVTSLSENVPPGKYTVVEYNPKGYTDVTPSLITVDTSKGDIVVNIVDEPLRTVTGVVLEDTNNDGDGDEPLVGVVLLLRDANGTVIANTTTDSNGMFSFENVPPGQYTVAEQNPSGYSDVTPNVVTADTSKGNVVVKFVDELPSSSPSTSNAPSSASRKSISGVVREDIDNDDDGDNALVGVVVVLIDAKGNVVGNTTTDSSGDFYFKDVLPGKYSVVEYNPKGYIDVTPNVISVAAFKGDVTGLEFIDEAVRKVTGVVLEDIDNDNVGDKPLAGVVLVLLDENGTVVANTTTDSNGNFSFENVPPGKYTVVEYNPKGYTDVTPSLITVDTSKGDIVVNIVDEPLRTVTGVVLEDTNNDGDGDEPFGWCSVVAT